MIIDDDVTLNFADVLSRLVLGNPDDNDNQIIGTDGDDNLQGLQGIDLLAGGSGDDIYTWRAGDGDDRIVDDGTDTGDRLVLADTASSELAWARRSPANGDDLVLRFTGGRDRLTLTDTLDADGVGIEEIEFSDGVTWQLVDMRQAVLEYSATANAETIRGFNGDDVLFGLGGDDLLIGGAGLDTYRFASDDGHEVIDDQSSSAADRLEITDLLSSEASVERLYKGSQTLVIRFAGNSDDSITIKHALSETGEGVETIAFADNVEWTRQDILDRLDNNAPVAIEDGIYSAREGEALILDATELLRNDFDSDGDTLFIIAVDGGENGTAEINGSGSIIFTGSSGFTGPASFTYTAADGRGGFATGTVSVRVSPPASARDDDGFSVDEDGFLTIETVRLLSNDADGDRMIVSQVFDAQNGSVSLASNGEISFTPVADYNGLASFKYVANTPEGGRSEATVYIDVIAQNDAPNAVNDSGFITDEDQAFSVNASDLLINDLDIDGDILSVTGVISNEDLQVELTEDGVVQVTPTPFFFGEASFDYTISDGNGESSTATVRVDVTPVNNAPEPTDDNYTINEDEPILFNASELLVNDVERDGDILNVSSVRNGYGGSVELFENDTVLFTPSSDFFGQAHFFYTVDDGQGGLVEARVNMQVDPVNDAPVARNESYLENDVFFLNGTEDVPLSIAMSDLLANDSDIDSSELSLVSISFAENGLAEISGDNIVFTPDADYWGEATFRYVTSDGELVDDATVTMYFDPVGDAPPLAQDDTISIYEDVETTILASAILANDTDIDRDILEIASISVLFGSRVSARLDENGNIVVQSDLNSNSTGYIDYIVTDNADGTDQGRIKVNIIPVNDAPTANPDTGSSSLDAPLVLRISDLLVNDEDVDNDLSDLTFEGVRFASNGITSIYNDEFVVVEYEQGFSGQVSLDYAIADPDGVEDEGTVAALISDSHLDTLSGSGIRDLIIGTYLGENILGLGGNDDLFGRQGDDLINGGDGADRIDGGDGFDTVVFEDSNIGVRADLTSRIGQGGFAQGDIYFNIEGLIGTQFADELAGDGNDNTLTGLDGNDLLIGRDGADILEGGEGNDTIIGGAGSDQLIGGEGSDTADYSDLTSGVASPAAVNISLANGTATGGDAEGDALTSIENLIGTEFDDVLEGDENSNRIEGGRGDDTILGGGGNDILEGGRGADNIQGGEGIDRAEYTLSDSGVAVNLTNASAGGGDALGDTFSSIELIVGSFHDDTIIGDANDNAFMGGRGADLINGGAGFDTADYSEADEAITLDLETGFGAAGEADGDQLVNIEKILASVHDDTVSGSGADETFVGGLGHDLLAGRAGSDVYEFGFGDGQDIIAENGVLSDIDRLALSSEIRVADVSLLREDDDLLIEFEQNGGILTDSVRVSDHFLGRETGIEEIAFGNGSNWDRATIENLIRVGRFNAQDDIIRFADEDVELVVTADRLTSNDATEGVDQLELVSVDAVSGGTVTLNENGSVTFLSDQDYYGDAFFDYTVRDPFGRESTARAEVNILPVNDAPLATDDGVFIGLEDTVLVIPLADIFDNDFDVDGDELTIVSFGPALDLNGDPLYPSVFGTGSNGRASVSGDSVNFTPSPDHFGFAGFTYTISDGNGETATAQVELNFLGVNDAPRPKEDKVTVRLGRSELIEISSLIGNDVDIEGDEISFVTAFDAINGTIVLLNGLQSPVLDPADAVYARFDASELGDASFTYTVEDEFGASANGNVDINVIPLNDPPNAKDDSGFETIEDQIIIIDPADLLANDTDPDGDPLYILELERFPLNGKAAFNGEGMIEFTPRADYNGNAGFVYTVTDGKDLDTDYPGTDTAFVSISIIPDNDAPQLRDDVVDGFEDLPITIIPAEAFANDLEPEGDVIFFETAEFLGILQNDFTNRLEVNFESELQSPVLDAANTVVAATLDDGSELPAWLSFDATDLTLTGMVPEPVPESFSVSLIFSYTDPETGEAVTYEDGIVIDPANPQALADGLIYEPDLIGLAGGSGIWSAELWTGHPLPGWLEFNSETQEFSLSGIEPDADESIARVRVEFTSDDEAAAPYAIEVRIDPNQPINSAINALLDNDPYFAAQDLMVLDIAEDAAVSAQESNLTPLPDWLAFDPEALTFTGTPPEKYVGTIQVRIDVGASAGTGQPAFALIREIVIDESLELTSDGGFMVTVFDELIDLVRPEDFNGAFAIEYTARDTKGAVSEDPAIIVINVEAQPELPDANDDSFEVLEDGQIEFTLAELLVNDGDDDGDPIHVVSIGEPAIGTLVVRIPELSFDLPGEPGGSYAVELQDGSELPDWLTIDQIDGRLHGTPSVEFADTLSLHITRTDENGDVETMSDLSVNGNEDVTLFYTTEPEYSGTITFDYVITDNAQGDDTGTVSINVIAANDPPVAEDDSFNGLEDTVLTLQQSDLLTNDIDVDGDDLRISSVLNAVNGAVELVNGEIYFTPDHNFDGLAVFDYVVTDDLDGEDIGSVSIDVIANNQAPVTGIDRFDGVEDTPFVVTVAELLGNDADPDGDNISFVSFEMEADDGVVFRLPDGSYALTPRDNFNGEINFTYTIADGRLNSVQTGNVIVDFTAINDDPVAIDDGNFTIGEDQAFAIDLSDLVVNDSDVEGDSLVVSRVLDPVNGSIAIVDGQAIFTPRADYFGNAGFAYEVSDGNGGTDIGFVSIFVTPSQDLPVAVSDQGYTINEDTFIDIPIADLLANDVDPDGDEISFVGVSGAVQLDGETIRFTPSENANGRLTFSYSITDGNGPSVSATVFVDVLPVDDDPVAGNDQVPGEEDEVLTIPVLSLIANDGDVDGHGLSLISVQNAVGGSVAFDGVGNVIFTPHANYFGPANFEYTLLDVSGASDTATVSIDLVSVNDAPVVATPLTDQSSPEDEIIGFVLPANTFSDVDGDTLVLSAFLADGGELPEWLEFDPGNRTFGGVPPQNFNGTLGVTVSATDGEFAASNTFSLAITPVNDEPDAQDDGIFTTLEDHAIVIAAGDLLANDTDVDNDMLSLLSAQDAENGTVALNEDGDVVFTPFANYNGAASFTYTISDGELTSTASASINVSAINDAPNSVNDHAFATEDEVLVLPLLQLLENDSDPDGDTLEIVGFASGDGYTTEFDGSGNVLITFDENLNGEVSLEYTISDGELTDTATLAIDVAAVNDQPQVRLLEDVHSDEDAGIDFVLPIDIASDVDGDLLTLSAARASGAAIPDWLVFDADNRRFTGTPPANFAGVITVAVIASDGELSEASEFDLVIDPVNDAPTISMPFSDRFINEDETFDIQLQQDLFSDVDGNTLSYFFELADDSALPNWLNADTSLLKLSGLPPQDFNGTQDIKITASDGTLSVSDVFKFTVNPVNDAPVVINPLPDILEDQTDPANNIYTGDSFAIDIPLSTFDDVDGDALQFAVTLGDGSALPDWITFDGSQLVGNAPTSAAGDYEISVLASDGTLQAEDGFVLAILQGNQAPNAEDDGIFDTRGEIPIRISPALLLENDSDADGDNLQIVNIGQGANGSVSLDQDNNIVYTAESGFIGNDQFEYIITDGTDTDSAIVSVIVGEPFDNVETGGNGSDFLIGDFRGDNYLSGGAGNDFLLAGRGDDVLLGGEGNDFLFSGSGNDILSGGSGNDLLLAGRGNDELSGGTGDDLLFGGRGSDELNGGAGDDLLFGGRGSDVFIFEQGGGSDTIVDYQTPRSGRRFSIAGDRIHLNVDGIDEFDELLATAQQQGGGVLFDFGNGDELFLSGTQLSALDKDSFTFF